MRCLRQKLRRRVGIGLIGRRFGGLVIGFIRGLIGRRFAGLRGLVHIIALACGERKSTGENKTKHKNVCGYFFHI